MTLETKLFSKLEPHAKRIKDGEGNDFDYLPAVLLQLMEVQKQQAQQLDDTAQLLDSIKVTVVSSGVASKTHIAAFESTVQRKMVQLEAAIKDTQTQIQNSQSILSEQLQSLDASTQRFQVKFTRILIAGLIASTVMIGLAIAILQRH